MLEGPAVRWGHKQGSVRMDGSRNKQSGFNLVELLLVVVALGVLAGAGWLIYQHNRTQVTAAAGGTQTTTQQTTTPPAPTVMYLTISEWGVQLPLSGAISRAYYVMNPASWKNPDGLPSQAWLGLKSFTSASCNAANNNDGQRGAIGAILRVPPAQLDQVTGQPLTEEYPNGVTVGGYYYAYQSWAAGNPCASPASLQPFGSAFAAAATGIVQAPAN